MKFSLFSILVFSAMVFFTGSIFQPFVFGFSEITDKKEYVNFQKYTGNRLLVFNDTKIDYCITNNEQNFFHKIARDSVQLWHDRIVEVTGNSKVWDMTLHVNPQDLEICDGYVNYLPTPSSTIFQVYGVAGFSHPQTPLANVTIYTNNYQATLRQMADEDIEFWDNITMEKFKDIVKNGKHRQFDHDMIKRLTLHELGHSLSLNHPKTEGSLQDAPGIMGYNMSFSQIDDDEVINIVRAYPNGFTKVAKPQPVILEGNNQKQMFTVGETVNLAIEIPNQKGKLPPTGVELYIFPEGTPSQKTGNAPIKIIQTKERDQLENSEIHLTDIQSALVHWGSDTKVLSVQFKVIKDFDAADIIVIAHRVGGFEEQWFLDNVFSATHALFSDLLLDLETTEYKFLLKGSNPNRAIEKESAFKLQQEKLYFETLVECLSDKNMKKCSNEINLENFY